MSWQDEFINMLFPISKKDVSIEGAYLLKQKHIPNSVFKYRHIDKEGYSIKNLQDDTIWLADPTTFNDPYDSAFSIDYSNLTKRFFLEHFDSLLTQSKLQKKLSEEQIEVVKKSDNPMREVTDILLKDEEEHKRKEMTEVSIDISNKLHNEILEHFNNSIKNSFKICSFSTNLNSILMWGHYAKNHRGFCIEYDLTDIPYEDYRARFLYPVVYSENIFDITDYMEKASGGDYNNLHLTLSALYKSKEWSYENEWRLVFAHGIVGKSQSYKMCKPKALYLGAQITDADEKVIVEIGNRKNVPVYKMTLSPSKFQLIPRTLEDCRRILSGLNNKAAL